jgi:diguanylate cyclase (GGDEF)-like protein
LEEDDIDCTAVASRGAVLAALAAKAPQRPCLIIASGAGVGQQFRIEGEVVVGRSEASHVRLDQDGVSRKHALLVRTPEGSVDVVDLESRNGTFVNGERVSRRELRDGDKIQIGTSAILKFSFQDDVDEALQKSLYDAATRDALTGLANKRTFADAIGRELAFAKRHKRPLSLVVFDIDRFKRINDGHGHPAGDYVLSTLAKTVAHAMRREDVVARVGGEEFAIVMRDITEAQALEAAERLRRVVEGTSFVFEGTKIPVTLSLGVAALSDEASVEQLVATADRRLYAAKENGRNRVVGSAPVRVAVRSESRPRPSVSP